MTIRKHIFGITIIFILSLPTILPLLQPGYFPMHDDTQVTRVLVMGRALLNGQFPVRWVSDLGYGFGYPIFNFYSPLPYYTGGIIYALGFDAVTATKIMMGIGMLLAGFIMYWVLVGYIGITGAIIGSLYYLYFPYHAVQLYVRGAVGELWFMALLPLYLGGVLSQFTNYKDRNWRLIGGVSLGGIVTSHTLLGYTTVFLSLLIFSLLIVIALLINKLDIVKIRKILVLFCIGLGLSAFFWIPAIVEMGYTNVASQISDSSDYKKHFVCLEQLWNSQWGFGGSALGCIDGMSFRLGKFHVVSFIIMTLLTVITLWKKRSNDYLLVTGLLTAFTGLFFALPISEVFWKLFPQFAYIQYPWRFLVFVAFGMSFVIGNGVKIFYSKFEFLLLSLAFMVLIMNGKLFVPQYLYSVTEKQFESREDISYRVSKISDEYLPQYFQKPGDISKIPTSILSAGDESLVETVINRETYKKIFVTLAKPQIVKIQIAYFPGWKIQLNGETIEPKIEYGLPEILIGEGRSAVEIIFTDTPVRKIANLISVTALLMLLFNYGKKTYA